MPESELHTRRRTKNYAVLAAIVGFIAVVFVVTILKMSVP
jgi:hypothetical protein